MIKTPHLLLRIVPLVLLFAVLEAQGQAPGRRISTVDRLRPENLEAVHLDREKLSSARHKVSLASGLRDYRAIMHVHAEDSAHTGGTRPELLAACKKTGVEIVLLTNHVRPPVDYINDSWRGLHDGVLFIPGAEYEGFLCYPLKSVMGKKPAGRDELISVITEGGGNIFLSHIEERPDWPTARLTGMEIYNHHADFKGELDFIRWLQLTAADPDRTRDFKTLLEKYPLEIFAAQQDYLENYVAKWDAESLTHRVTGVAANDCHHNQVVTVKVGGPDTLEIWMTGDKEPSFNIKSSRAPRIPELTRGRAKGEVVTTFDLDPYERSLSYVTTHILTSKLDEPSVRKGLEAAHVYVSHDWICDPQGFAFIAEAGRKRIGVIGDAVKMVPGLSLRLEAPVAGKIRMFRNGRLISESDGHSLNLKVSEPGVYRPEVWLSVGGELRPWIYSNAIEVK